MGTTRKRPRRLLLGPVLITERSSRESSARVNTAGSTPPLRRLSAVCVQRVVDAHHAFEHVIPERRTHGYQDPHQEQPPNLVEPFFLQVLSVLGGSQQYGILPQICGDRLAVPVIDLSGIRRVRRSRRVLARLFSIYDRGSSPRNGLRKILVGGEYLVDPDQSGVQGKHDQETESDHPLFVLASVRLLKRCASCFIGPRYIVFSLLNRRCRRGNDALQLRWGKFNPVQQVPEVFLAEVFEGRYVQPPPLQGAGHLRQLQIVAHKLLNGFFQGLGLRIKQRFENLLNRLDNYTQDKNQDYERQ